MNDQNPNSQLDIKSLGFDWSLVIGHWDFLLVLIAFLLPTYLLRFSLFGIPTTLLEVLIWLAFLTGALQPTVRSSWADAWKSFSLPRVALAKWGVFIFLFSAVLSTAISPHLETSLGILKGWIITPMLYGFMVYAATHYNLLTTHRILKALLLSGLVVALLGLSQLGTLDRIRGPFDVPNSLALFLAPLAVLAFYWSLGIGHWSFSRSATVIMFLALLLTQSLAGVLSVIVVAVLGIFYLRRNPLNPLYQGETTSLDKGRSGGIIFLVLIATLFFLVPKAQYLLQPASSAHVRLQLWSISWDLIKEHPLLGIGLGTFEPAYQQKLHERFLQPTHYSLQPLPEFVFRDPHNWILSFWLNLGLLGLLSFVFLNGYALWQASQRPRLLTTHYSLLPALLALLVFGLLDTIYWKNDLATLHWTLLALVISGIIKP